MRESVAVDEDANTYVAVARTACQPVLGGKGDIIHLDALTVAGLVVTNEESDVL